MESVLVPIFNFQIEARFLMVVVGQKEVFWFAVFPEQMRTLGAREFFSKIMGDGVVA